jgi:hypothetical protein
MQARTVMSINQIFSAGLAVANADELRSLELLSEEIGCEIDRRQVSGEWTYEPVFSRIELEDGSFWLERVS